MYTGLTAKLTVDDKDVAYISNWSVEETRDTVEVTQLGKQSKHIAPTLYSWTASADGTADFAEANGQKTLRDAMIDGKKIIAKFYLSENDYFVGNAYVTSLSTDISAEDKGNISISLTGCGKLKLETKKADNGSAGQGSAGNNNGDEE